MPQYIKKIRVPVRVAHGGEEPVEGSLSLAPRAELRDGPETLLERLNAGDRVVPFGRASDGRMFLLTRLDIESVTPAERVAAALVCPPNYLVTREERVHIRFQNGREIAGVVQMELPESINRVSDFLNGDDDFFPLLTSEGILLVNKHRLRSILVFESSPLPLGHRFKKRAIAL